MGIKMKSVVLLKKEFRLGFKKEKAEPRLCNSDHAPSPLPPPHPPPSEDEWT